MSARIFSSKSPAPNRQVPAQTWEGQAYSRGRCGRVSPVPVQMWMRRCFSEAALRSPLCVRVCTSVCVPVCVRVQVVLFPFTDYPKMYPFPTTHPCDRQSMVDVAAPDLARFPRFADAQVAAPLPLSR